MCILLPKLVNEWPLEAHCDVTEPLTWCNKPVAKDLLYGSAYLKVRIGTFVKKEVWWWWLPKVGREQIGDAWGKRCLLIGKGLIKKKKRNVLYSHMTAKYSNYCSKWRNGRLCGLHLNKEQKELCHIFKWREKSKTMCSVVLSEARESRCVQDGQ